MPFGEIKFMAAAALDHVLFLFLFFKSPSCVSVPLYSLLFLLKTDLNRNITVISVLTKKKTFSKSLCSKN